MLEIYLPIAGIAKHPLEIIILGGIGGILSGLLGIGGGILIAPGLMFLGIRPEIAVASHLNQVLSTSVSGGLAYWHRRSLDYRLLLHILMGGIVGALIGLSLVMHLRATCQLQQLIQAGYAVLLPLIGGGILWDCWKRRQEINTTAPITPHGWHFWKHWPWQRYFPQSQLRISAVAPVLVGLLSGVLVAIFGAGGGIVMVPAMIYGLGVPNRIAMGNSLVVSACLTLMLTLGHSVLNGSVDMVLAALLTLGGGIGAQVGAWLSFHTREYYLRVLLAIIILISSFKLITGPGCFEVGLTPPLPHDVSQFIRTIFNLHLTKPWVYSAICAIWAILIGVLADQLFRSRRKK